ncbi:coiled-coil domain-containing protein [Streptomyces omiyaensis]|uniref:Coiled-coil domain-containing protein n=1 Tax=Streptomyces omiyaensis TaxID=68247 RepID=A0ABW7BNA9_9ACTN
MPSHRRPKQPHPRYAGVVTAAAAAAVALSAQQATAGPLPGPTGKGGRARIDGLHEEATRATERYNGAEERAEALRRRAGTLRNGVARKQAGPDELRYRIGLLAAGRYRAGGLGPALRLLLSPDPDARLERAAGPPSGRRSGTPAPHWHVVSPFRPTAPRPSSVRNTWRGYQLFR